MTNVCVVFLSTLALQCIVALCSVPSFTVNLNDPPKQRWVNVTRYYKDELIAMNLAQKPIFDRHLGDQKQSWLDNITFDPEYLEELQGIVETANHPEIELDGLKLSNMLYEMESPTATACSGVLWAMPNGTVLHGRNMDYFIEFEMDGRVLNWPDVTFEVTFIRDGQPLMKATQWPGGVGLHTAMRFGGWSFEQNTRTPNNWRENLAAGQKGGQVNGLVVRRLMETIPDFDTAVEQVYAANYMAPQYFIMSGSGPHQGAVLTIDRNSGHEDGTPPIQYVGNSSGEPWYLVQTNDDLLEQPKDPRRPIANAMLTKGTQSIVDENHLLQFMHTPLLFNPLTVFTTVMSPATGYYTTILPDEPPFAPTKVAQMFAGSSASLLEKNHTVPHQLPETHSHRRNKFLAQQHMEGDATSFLQVGVQRLDL